MAGIGQFFQALMGILPPWAVGVLAALVVAALAPGWFDSMRIKQIRGLLRRVHREAEPDRARVVGEALALAGDRPMRLAALAREAETRALPAVRVVALARLRGAGRAGEKELASLEGKPRPAEHPLQAAIAVERLIEEGLVHAARERLDEARRKYPGDPDLQAAAEKLDAR